ncbi:MAG: hypothetical protein ACRDZX_01870, partial [Acidimicrobiales bacterium]
MAQALTRQAQAGAATAPGDGPEAGQRAAAVLARARARAALPGPPPSPAAVEMALAERRSDFAEPDVLAALAETSPAGMDLRQASTWCRRWCEAATPVQRPGGGQRARWTSALARHFDQAVLDAAAEARFAHLAEVSPLLAEAELGALGFRGEAAEAGARLACSGAGIAVVPRGPWLAQAACIDAARAIWQASGISVQLASPSDVAERRWRALTALRPAAG